MSKEKRKIIFNIAVVGLSGTEQIKGTSGVGKSCLCNRFVREKADSYYPDHTSVLSQSDFGGRVVNNDHFLYWGEVSKQDDNGLDYKFNIIEQTEFIDDQSYQAHRSSSNQVYYKRSAQTKISSAEKMMYICTDQLGIESDFEAKPMPDGKLTIDGFILCIDVSHVTNRTIDDQLKFAEHCYHYLGKTKKPVLVALTKCDEALPAYIDQAEKFAAAAGGKRSSSLPVVETSASENINVTSTFLILAQMIDKTRSKSKIVSFEDAAQVRKELLKDAKERLESLLEQTVLDYHESWQSARKTLEDKPQYLDYVDLEGKNAASKIFRKHVTCLRDEFRLNLQCEYLRFFPRALRIILADVSLVRTTWNETLQAMTQLAEFKNWIVSLDELYPDTRNLPWYESPHMMSLEDRRIPFELMNTPDAERYFLFHRQELEAKQRRSEMKLKFREDLAKSPEVTPGTDWGDVASVFKHESLSEITENELSTIYEQFQAEIVEKAKQDFQELLFEKSEIFVTSSNQTQLDIHDALKPDPRYMAMANLPNEKNEILTRHISEALYPPDDNWGAKILASALNLHRARLTREVPNKTSSSALRWQLTRDSDTLNVVLLGANGLSRELANEITVHSSDEYTLDGCIHPLRLRSIDGDVSLPANSFKTSSFSPHGCIAVYSSVESLNYIESSLEKTVVSSSESPEVENVPPFQGLPVFILLASFSNSEKEVHKLRDAGERLASRIGCPFIDVLPPEYAYNRRFHESQIRLAMKSLISGIEERAGSGRGSSVATEEQGRKVTPPDAPPDLRIIMCTRKEDFQTSEVALAPLLNHTSFRDPGPIDEDDEPSDDTVVVETYLGTRRRRIAVTITSYQCARNHLSKGSPIHGFILVYDTLLKSSFSIMKVFADNTASSYPLLVLCISPDDKKPAAAFFQQTNTARQLVVDGNALADRLRAKFITASARHRRQTEVYSTFFKDAWEHKEETESIHKINRVVVEEDSVKENVEGEQQRPQPAPRSSLQKKKATSTEQLASKSACESPRGDAPPMSPPSTLHFNAPSQSSYGESQVDAGFTTPGSVWSNGSDDYQADTDTPNTSPTAGLLENEVNPDYSDYSFGSNRKTPPMQRSHLYPGVSSQPGKLKPELLNKVEAGMRTRPPNLSDVFAPVLRGSSDPPYMAINDQTKVGGVKVLPSPLEGAKTPTGVKTPQESKNDSKLQAISRAAAGMQRRSATNRTTKRMAPKVPEIDSSPTTAQPPTPSEQPSRHSGPDILSPSLCGRTETDGSVLSKKHHTSSHEDLPHLNIVLTSPITAIPKEKLILKRAKEEEKKRKEEKKIKEKEQQRRSKHKHGARHTQPTSHNTGNKHNVSGYFNKKLDDIIQGLNHMVPLFVELCVRYIENSGVQLEGLYRVPANAKERETLISRFDEDNKYDLAASEASVHTVAGCLTWFFSHKNLPEPLVPSYLHDELEEAVSDISSSSLRNMAVRGVVRKLPYSHYATFKFICTHLRKVSDHCSENKMTVDNLAICWCNTIFRPDLECQLPKPFYKLVLCLCINQCGFVFYDQQEL